MHAASYTQPDDTHLNAPPEGQLGSAGFYPQGLLYDH